MKTWNATALTGGAARALDAIPIASISDNDRAHVVASNVFCCYEFDSAGTDAESSPTVIRPDDYATVGAGVWRMVGSPYGNSIPVGTVLTWPTGTVPSGYLECNGSAISRTTYATLFGVISDDYGVGDGETTFNLPDYRGEFLRGWDHAAANDPDAATRTDRGDGTIGDYVGTKQAEGLKAHSHVILSNGDGSGTYRYTGNTKYNGDDVSTASTGGNETRPRNVNVMYCIKY
jgi:microcystin-dependent protein